MKMERRRKMIEGNAVWKGVRGKRKMERGKNDDRNKIERRRKTDRKNDGKRNGKIKKKEREVGPETRWKVKKNYRKRVERRRKDLKRGFRVVGMVAEIEMDIGRKYVRGDGRRRLDNRKKTEVGRKIVERG
jgi:hypothetical protein